MELKQLHSDERQPKSEPPSNFHREGVLIHFFESKPHPFEFRYGYGLEPKLERGLFPSSSSDAVKTFGQHYQSQAFKNHEFGLRLIHFFFQLTSEPLVFTWVPFSSFSPQLWELKKIFLMKTEIFHNPMKPGAGALRKSPNMLRFGIKLRVLEILEAPYLCLSAKPSVLKKSNSCNCLLRAILPSIGTHNSH